MLRVRIALWDCLLLDRPYHEPVADTEPDTPDTAPGSEVAADIPDLARVVQELLDAYHGPGVAVIDLRPALATFGQMTPWLSYTCTVNYFTPYKVQAANSARHWVLGLCVAQAAE